MGTSEGGIQSVRACVTYVFVYPCMPCLRKYKMQRGFWCNVHLSVAALPFLAPQLKQQCPLDLLIIDEHMHQTPDLHLHIILCQ